MSHFFTAASIIILSLTLILQHRSIRNLKTGFEERLKEHIAAERIQKDEYLKLLADYRRDGFDVMNTYNAEISNIRDGLSETAQKVDDLQRGIIPDYEKAKEAAKALDEFNESVAIIAGFDPMDAIRGRRGGGEF